METDWNMSNHVLSEARVYPRRPKRKIDPFCCLWPANLPAKTWKVEMFGGWTWRMDVFAPLFRKDSVSSQTKAQ